jgi:hypothetical protein
MIVLCLTNFAVNAFCIDYLMAYGGDVPGWKLAISIFVDLLTMIYATHWCWSRR